MSDSSGNDAVGDAQIRHALHTLAALLSPIAAESRKAADTRQFNEAAEARINKIFTIKQRDEGHFFLSSIGGLIDLLRSSDNILRADRDFLADILAGEYGRGEGRVSLRAGEKERRINAYAAYKLEMTKRPRPSAEQVIASVADRFDFTLLQMRDVVRKAPKSEVVVGEDRRTKA